VQHSSAAQPVLAFQRTEDDILYMPLPNPATWTGTQLSTTLRRNGPRHYRLSVISSGVPSASVVRLVQRRAGPDGPDNDCDGAGADRDCDDANPLIWERPGRSGASTC